MINLYALNEINKNQDGPLRSWRFNIGIQYKSDVHFVFQVNFSKRDGSIYINFPYFEFTDGLVSICNFPVGSGPIDLNLEEDAKVTSHLVKYSHPPSGEAHFSQDGKVISSVRKQSIPLKEYNGHLFTCQVQGLQSYSKALFRKMEKLEKRTPVYLILPNPEPCALKFVGMLYDEDIIMKSVVAGQYGPCIVLDDIHQGPAICLLCAPPKESSLEHKVLAISCRDRKLLNVNDGAALSFIGGFDNSMLDVSKQTTFLSLLYPITNKKEMQNRLGTIDYSPDCLS